jgi:protein TonB
LEFSLPAQLSLQNYSPSNASSFTPSLLAIGFALILHGVLFGAYALLPADIVPPQLATIEVSLSPAMPVPRTQPPPSLKPRAPVLPAPPEKLTPPPPALPVEPVAQPAPPVIPQAVPQIAPPPVSVAPPVAQPVIPQPVVPQQEEIQPIFKLTRVPGFSRKVEPIYPPTERSSGTQATVLAEVTLNSRGEVLSVRIVKSGGSRFDEAVKQALQKSSFSPGMMDTKPVATRIMVPFRFNLN